MILKARYELNCAKSDIESKPTNHLAMHFLCSNCDRRRDGRPGKVTAQDATDLCRTVRLTSGNVGYIDVKTNVFYFLYTARFYVFNSFCYFTAFFILKNGVCSYY